MAVQETTLGPQPPEGQVFASEGRQPGERGGDALTTGPEQSGDENATLIKVPLTQRLRAE